MEYLMFVTVDPAAPPVPDAERFSIDDWVAEGDARGIRIRGERLRPPEDATSLRLRDGELLVTDGPFAESKEWIAGYDILECEDLDEAIAYASKHPMVQTGILELRPMWPFEDE
jgi:hypothetical protein